MVAINGKSQAGGSRNGFEEVEDKDWGARFVHMSGKVHIGC